MFLKKIEVKYKSCCESHKHIKFILFFTENVVETLDNMEEDEAEQQKKSRISTSTAPVIVGRNIIDTTQNNLCINKSLFFYLYSL